MRKNETRGHETHDKKEKNEDFRWDDIRGQRGKEVRRETTEVETRVFADHWLSTAAEGDCQGDGCL